jgi:hypothetical protein
MIAPNLSKASENNKFLRPREIKRAASRDKSRKRIDQPPVAQAQQCLGSKVSPR